MTERDVKICTWLIYHTHVLSGRIDDFTLSLDPVTCEPMIVWVTEDERGKELLSRIAFTKENRKFCVNHCWRTLHELAAGVADWLPEVEYHVLLK